MNTLVMLHRFTPFKRDSARRIDRVIDYFGEPLRIPARRHEQTGVIEMRLFQSRRRTDRGVSVTVSLSARTR